MRRRRQGPKISFSDLTLGERIVMIAWIAAAGLLPVVGIVLALVSSGTGRGVGIMFLVIGLVAAAVPISPVLAPRVERRVQASPSKR